MNLQLIEHSLSNVPMRVDCVAESVVEGNQN
jgi:hypothetical protein